MKILFLVLHRKNRSPGQRYRHEQYIEYLEKNGFECVFSPLLTTERDDKIFYGSSLFPKIRIGIKALFRRIKSVITANHFDAIYIYRDAFFFGTFFEKWLQRKKLKLIYDFDDAIWLKDENPNQGIFNKLKNPNKIATICGIVNTVIVGNEYLSKYAKSYNNNVVIIPSTIDFEIYKDQVHVYEKDKICIGWTGSFSTIKHFESILESLTTIKEKYGESVYFKLIGDANYRNDLLQIKGISWCAQTETEDLMELDIGIMPLPDNEWTQGKCGMKGLQYMALGIPTVMSAVGVNKDIIINGQNGLLATTKEEWVDQLSMLIESAEYRQKLGEQGRMTVGNNYSVEANKEKWVSAFIAV